jgi:YbgC/YbaW family acyl-CoA thioester hydrolase
MPSTHTRTGGPGNVVRWSEYRLRRRVEFHETDGAAIVTFSAFFRYMQEAESALWRAAGLSIAPPGAEVGFPRVAAACEFHRPLRFEDEFEVRIRVAAMTQKTIRYSCTMHRLDDHIATGTMTVVCVRKLADGSMKAVPIPADIAARFEVASGGTAGTGIESSSQGPDV